jgi:hypothetical protein
MNKVSFASHPLLGIPAYVGARLIALTPRAGCRSTLVSRARVPSGCFLPPQDLSRHPTAHAPPHCRPWLPPQFATADPSLEGQGVRSRRSGAPYFGAPYPLFFLPYLFHTASGLAWNPQVREGGELQLQAGV